MKVKWTNVLYIVCLAASVTVAVCTLGISAKCGRYHTQEPERPLQPGDLVQHKLIDTWNGLVINNPDGPLFHLRMVTDNSQTYIDTYDIEWERK